MKRFIKNFICFSLCGLIATAALAQHTTCQEEFNEYISEISPSIKQYVLNILPTIPGWCSSAKASAMMDLIFETRPQVCVEIGVFCGASLFPTASALKFLNQGVVYGIDPWNVYECVKHYPDNSEHARWWVSVDLESICHQCFNLIRGYNLSNNCIIIRDTSERASHRINAIDILHIDADHSDVSAFLDVLNYAPKVKVGGFIWFDGWASASRAFEYLKKTCYVKQVIDEGRCVLLEKVFPDSKCQERRE